MNALLKLFWRRTQPLRRPFERKFEAYLAKHLRPYERQVTDESNMLMDHVIRELVRLQDQLEVLHSQVEALTGGVSYSASALQPGRDRDGGSERLKAG